VLGLLLISAGVAETVRLVRSGDGGFWFWFPTLVGGGALILAGTFLMPRAPMPGFWLIMAGAAAGILPTAWTLVVPVLLVLLIVMSARQAATAEE